MILGIESTAHTFGVGIVDNGNKKVFFDASKYESGTYLVKVISANGTSVSKVVVR